MIFAKNKKTAILLFMILVLGFLSVLGVIFLNPYPLKFKEEISLASQKFGVSPSLVASMINAESGFKETAKSSKGAVGLMQLMPSTAKWLCEKQGQEFFEENLFDAKNNINLGTYYMHYLLEKFESVETAICAYNAGEGNVMLWLVNDKYAPNHKTIISTPYPETNAYLGKVMKGISVYQKKFKEN
ncbi:MAG: lytic transglycosylase domain-containing protein [Clostridia bacterium]|nr:lytic transglycosylase domain-containing protein [Clostridia bacterium]